MLETFRTLLAVKYPQKFKKNELVSPLRQRQDFLSMIFRKCFHNLIFNFESYFVRIQDAFSRFFKCLTREQDLRMLFFDKSLSDLGLDLSSNIYHLLCHKISHNNDSRLKKSNECPNLAKCNFAPESPVPQPHTKDNTKDHTLSHRGMTCLVTLNFLKF